MNRRSLIKTTILVFAVLVLSGPAWQRAQAREIAPPNIVVFLIDDMGVMDTSVPFLLDQNGVPEKHPLNQYYQTPQMERLAARGIRFSTFYAMSVCSPTRVSIMTGQNSARHHVTNWIQPDRNNAGPSGPPNWNWRGLTSSSVTLPRLLKQAGYRTIHVGKGHFGPRDAEGSNPVNIGFDVNVGGGAMGQPATYYGQQNYGNGKKLAANAVPGLDKYHGTDTFLTEALTQEAKHHVSAAVKEGKPFYLNFAHYAVHAPFNSDSRFADRYKNSGKPEKARAFATLIEGIDRSLGQILDHLEAEKVADNTLVIFLGDNGSDAPLGDPHQVGSSAPLRGMKGTHYEGGMRVPFIAAWAAPNAESAHQQRVTIPSGQVQQTWAAVYDLFPTILEVAGVALPSEHPVDGLSLVPLLSGKAGLSHHKSFLMHYPHAHRSSYFTVYRQGDWKLVCHYLPKDTVAPGRFELFNLKDDPYEQSNLASADNVRLKEMLDSMNEALVHQAAQFPIDQAGAAVGPVLP